MPKAISLKEGEFVCENRFRFLHFASEEEKTKAPKSYRKFRCGVFECQDCYEHTIFIAPVARLLRGEIKYCPYCANASRSNKNLKYHYKYGEFVGDSHNLIYIEEAGRDKEKSRLVTVQDISDGIIFITRLSNILSGRTKCSPQQVSLERKQNLEKYRDTRKFSRKYQVGDILGLNNNMLFIQETEPVIDNQGHKRRTGIFKNLYNNKEVHSRLKNIIDGMNQGLEYNSVGEIKISYILKKLSIIFIKEYSFLDCVNPKTNKKLRFDFYLPDYNCCIEYDGEQHFHPSKSGWNTKNNYTETKYRDNIKNMYCDKNKISLIRIPYYDFDKIDEEYILNKINKLNK